MHPVDLAHKPVSRLPLYPGGGGPLGTVRGEVLSERLSHLLQCRLALLPGLSGLLHQRVQMRLTVVCRGSDVSNESAHAIAQVSHGCKPPYSGLLLLLNPSAAGTHA